ncbi:MAG: stage V sporulation protein AB [Lachnospiraceae bacterium]|jgi:stage V sporulation protein AB|nr:stage V sporulation protein AB [Lachnospiraceae bacterium]
MWIRQVILGIVGLSSGFAVAGGMFAFLIALGVVSRFAGKTHTAKYILYYEDAAAIGGILGNLVSIYAFPVPVGMAGVVSFGLFSGIFTGAWAMALTEIVDAVPIFSRRIRLKTGLPWIILSMALGRTAGALVYAYFGF